MTTPQIWPHVTWLTLVEIRRMGIAFISEIDHNDGDDKKSKREGERATKYKLQLNSCTPLNAVPKLGIDRAQQSNKNWPGRLLAAMRYKYSIFHKFPSTQSSIQFHLISFSSNFFDSCSFKHCVLLTFRFSFGYLFIRFFFDIHVQCIESNWMLWKPIL